MDDDEGKVLADLSFTLECKIIRDKDRIRVSITTPDRLHTRETLYLLVDASEEPQYPVDGSWKITLEDIETAAVRFERNLLLPPSNLVSLACTVFVKTLAEVLREKYSLEFPTVMEWAQLEEKQRNVKHFGQPHTGPARNFPAFLAKLKEKRQEHYQKTGSIPTALANVATAIATEDKGKKMTRQTLESRIERANRKWKDDVEKLTRPRRKIIRIKQGTRDAVR